MEKIIFNYLSIGILNPEPIAEEEPLPAAQNQTVPDQQTTQNTTGSAVLPEGQQPEGVVLSSEKLIISFHLPLTPEVIGLVDEKSHIITLDVPYGTDVKNLKPLIVVSPEAMVSPASDLVQDFSKVVNYTVTAKDGSMQAYGVRVIIGAPTTPEKKSGGYGFILLIVILILLVVAVGIGIFIYLRRRSKKQKMIQ